MVRSKKNKLKKIFFSQKFITLVGLAAILLISFPFAKNLVKQYRINKEISELKQEISELENKSGALKNFISLVDSDQYAENIARSDLNLKKPGEEKIVIKTDAGAAPSSTEPGNPIFNIPGYKKAEPKQESSNPEKWLNYFLK